mgnify:CR=1 FL=1
MTIKDWLKTAKKSIDALDAELILLNVKKYSDRSELLLRENSKLTETEEKAAKNLLSRRKNGEPLAYILGYREFYGRKFFIDRNVLIPRPETEVIVDFVTCECEKNPEDWQIFDIGTGSGCIGVSLFLELSKKNKVNVVCSDISNQALEVAEKNYTRLRSGSLANSLSHISFVKSDLTESLEMDLNKSTIIVANLPYVSREWNWLDKEALSYEPQIALFAKQNGLELIYKLISQIKEKIDTRSNLNARLILVLEMDKSQQNEIIEYGRQFGYDTEKISDYVLKIEFVKHQR